MTTQIKICGFTDPKEAAYISYPDVSMMGMVLFFPKSKRNISIERAKDIMKAVDPRIQKVAVVVSPTVDQAIEIEKAGFDYMQVHGTLSEDVLKKTSISIIKAFNLGDEQNPSYEINDRIKAYLFDAAEPGSGKSFDWSILSSMKRTKKWILAGGLNAHNVVQAIEMVHPDAVDISSGVEYEDKPGKDPAKIAEFINQVTGRLVTSD